jgi:hypothetical protein
MTRPMGFNTPLDWTFGNLYRPPIHQTLGVWLGCGGLVLSQRMWCCPKECGVVLKNVVLSLGTVPFIEFSLLTKQLTKPD